VRVLLTGSAGFIGRHIAERLQDHHVLGIDLNGTPRRDVKNWFRNNENPVPFDLVIHCAAVVGGRAVVEESKLAHAANLEIDAALFRWAEHAQPKRIVYFSSAIAYPVAQAAGPAWRPFREDDLHLSSPGMPDELYGWAKLTGEILASRSSVPVTVVRPFCVYGNGQDSAHPVAQFAKQVSERKDPVTVWGTGMQIRDFIHVSDVASGILSLAEQGVNSPVNLATGRGTTLTELMRMLADEAGYHPEIKALRDKPSGLPYWVGDTGKLRRFYVPEISLEEGISRIVKGLQ
jgi:nucleoside-diphosphate-sugar epimerase